MSVKRTLFSTVGGSRKKGLNRRYPNLVNAFSTIVKATPTVVKVAPTLAKLVQDPILKEKTLQDTIFYLKLPKWLRSVLECLDAKAIQALRNELNRQKPWLGELFDRIVNEIKASDRKDVALFLTKEDLQELAPVESDVWGILRSAKGLLLEEDLPSLVPPRPLYVELPLFIGIGAYKSLPPCGKEAVQRLEICTINLIEAILDKYYQGLGKNVFKPLFFFTKDKLNP
ncbi:MAG: hypothetical protein ACK5T0_00010 [Vampirovibrionales bacterium]